jgi:hypothetical protein
MAKGPAGATVTDGAPVGAGDVASDSIGFWVTADDGDVPGGAPLTADWLVHAAASTAIRRTPLVRRIAIRLLKVMGETLTGRSCFTP